MKKIILSAIGLTIIPLIGYFISKSQRKVKKNQSKLYAGIELGGTNYNVAIAQSVLNNQGDILDFKIIKRKNGITYQDPEIALKQIRQFISTSHQSIIAQQKKQRQLHFIGIASFGPVCLDKNSAAFGSITTTPKEKWRNINVLKALTDKFQAQKEIDTDVNSCAYAEFRLGNHKIKESLAYITVGTGVGVGIIANGKTVHGLTHPQGGHIIGQRHPQQYQHFKGVCPNHKEQTCIEGMVCNKSIAERLNVDFTELATISEDVRVWKLVGYYLAQLCLSITLLVSPQVIVIGGGIMNRSIIYRFIHEQFIRMLAGYIDHPLLKAGAVQKYIVPPKLGSDVGIKGAIALSFM